MIGFGIVGAIITLGLLWATVGWALSSIAWGQLWLIGAPIRWLGAYADDLGWASFVLGAGGLTWLLFPVTATAVTGLFLDRICNAVEAEHYPHLPPARPQPIAEVVANSARFLGVTILINLLALPFYIILLVLLGSGALLYLLVNGYLIGREFFEMVANRRLKPIEADSLRRQNRYRVILFGVIGALILTIPFVNLIAPVITAAAAVHFFQRLSQRHRQPKAG